MNIIRGIIITVLEGLIKRFNAFGRTDETIGNREYFQHYGFTSRPKPGAEIIIIHEGNHYLAIASDDRRYRLAVEEGEVALYTDEGDAVHMKRGNNIEVTCGNKLTATVENEVEITTKVATVNATESCEITSPAVTIDSTSLTIDVSTTIEMTSPALTINAAGSVVVNSPAIQLGEGATRALLDERAVAIYNQHSHANLGANNPTPQMSIENHATSVTKAL